MADFNQPGLTSLYADMLNVLKDRDVSAMKWLDGTTDSNIPSNAKRWNATNNYFEKYNGTSWSALTSKYMIDVDTVDGCTVNDLGSSTTDLWTASKINSTKLNTSAYTAADVLNKIKTVDGTSSGLDADLLDGMHAASTNTASTVVSRDASGNFSAGTITATLNGTADNAKYQQLIGGQTSCDAYFKATPAGKTSFNEGYNITDAPTTNNWYFLHSIRYSNGSNYWGTQIAYGWEGNANLIYQRNIMEGTWSAWTRVDVSGANISELVNNVGYITTDGRAYPRKVGGGAINFNWSGQGGQPTWLWGGNDSGGGVDMYVWNPSNFSVNYANSAGSITYGAAAYGVAQLPCGELGTYAFLTRTVASQDIYAGGIYAGSELCYSGVEEDEYNYGGAYGYLSKGAAVSGTWRAMGASNSSGTYAATLFLRIA